MEMLSLESMMESSEVHRSCPGIQGPVGSRHREGGTKAHPQTEGWGMEVAGLGMVQSVGATGSWRIVPGRLMCELGEGKGA